MQQTKQCAWLKRATRESCSAKSHLQPLFAEWMLTAPPNLVATLLRNTQFSTVPPQTGVLRSEKSKGGVRRESAWETKREKKEGKKRRKRSGKLKKTLKRCWAGGVGGTASTLSGTTLWLKSTCHALQLQLTNCMHLCPRGSIGMTILSVHKTKQYKTKHRTTRTYSS